MLSFRFMTDYLKICHIPQIPNGGLLSRGWNMVFFYNNHGITEYFPTTKIGFLMKSGRAGETVKHF